MLIRKWTALGAILILTGTVALSPAATAGVTAPVGDLGDVAILVLDGFTEEKSSTADGKANCPRVGLGANEVGSGGGGGGLPSGVTHGQVVYEVLQSELSRPRHRLEHLGTPPAIEHPLVMPGYVDTWRSGDQRVLLVGVDTRGFDTGVIAGSLDSIINIVRHATGITRFVLNMSFLLLPCDIPAWFKAAGAGLTSNGLLEAYRAIIEAVPELAHLAAELDRLEHDAATVEAILHDPALAVARPMLDVNLFYGLFADVELADLLTSQNPPAMPMSAYLQVVNDPLKVLLDWPPAGVRLVAAGAAGNGVFLPSATGRGTRVQFDFPFAPALWNSVVSVSAAGPQPPARAAYANSGEVMMDASNPYEAAGTSFAAPRLSALEALYLRGGGPVVCDGHTPPLGYARLADPTAPGADRPEWNNLALSSAVAPSDPALRTCLQFAGRVSAP